MTVSIIAVGRAGGPLAPAIADYERRAGRYWRLDIREVRRGRGRGGGEAMRREARSIRSCLRPHFLTVALAREGRRFSSLELARWMERILVGPERGVHFIVGGAFGLDPSLRGECDLSLSLSSLTFPHDLARLALAEQLYRAGTILRNEPYHKGNE